MKAPDGPGLGVELDEKMLLAIALSASDSTLPLEAGSLRAELDDAALLCLGDIAGAAVLPPKQTFVGFLPSTSTSRSSFAGRRTRWQLLPFRAA